jgi:isoamylase
VLRRATENRDGSVSILNLLLNPINEDRSFQLPPPVLPSHVLIDSARPEAPERKVADNKLDVLAHSAVLVYSLLQRSAR